MYSFTSSLSCLCRKCSVLTRQKNATFAHGMFLVGVDKLKVKCIHTQNGPPPSKENDLIGPPDTKSNLRPVIFHVPPNETDEQRKYRMMRQETHDWNQKFWTDHNEKFFREKEQFIKSKLEEKKIENSSDETRITAEELSEFYKKFLDENYSVHAKYNRDWYKRNLKLLWPAFQVFLQKFTLRKNKR